MRALAIVIPAYKPEYFSTALASVAAQSDSRFRVYVGNDGGPVELEEVCSSFSEIDVTYKRFAANVGRRSLTGHWNRCVGMSCEPWVWLFADDDVMAPECVASFYDALDGGEDRNVVRFNTEVIGARGETIRQNPLHPANESGVEFIFSRLRGERNSYAVEYIFRREAFERSGGFADYPAAWCVDDVSWFQFSRRGGIRTLPHGKVSWRASGLNITDASHRYQREKLTAASKFLRFVEHEVRPADDGVRTREEWRRASERWFLDQVRYLMPLSLRLCLESVRSSQGVWSSSTPTKIVRVALWNMQATLGKGIKRLTRLIVPRNRVASG